jgi:hypothetical protein
MSITKQISRTIYDNSKIGVGDVIEFNEYTSTVFTKPKVSHRVAGVVTSVEELTIWVSARGGMTDHKVGNFGLPVERCEEITVIHRHHFNTKEERE